MTMSKRAHELSFEANRAAVAFAGLLTAAGAEPVAGSGYTRQALSLATDGAQAAELSFGPFELDAADLTQYAIYDRDGNEMGREALEPPCPQRRGIVGVLPKGTIRLESGA